MALPGSSPRWREVEAQLRSPPVLPAFRLIHNRVTPKKPDKVALCERFCAKRLHFVEIRWLRAAGNFGRVVFVEQQQSHHWTAKEIIEHIARKHDIAIKDIKGTSRERRFAWPRQEAYYEVARLTPMSETHIGKIFNRDASSIWWGIRAHIARGESPIRGIQLTDKHRVIGRKRAPGGGRNPIWRDDRMDMLKGLLAGGMSQRSAGFVMGCSRVAIAAVLRREREKQAASKSTPAD